MGVWGLLRQKALPEATPFRPSLSCRNDSAWEGLYNALGAPLAASILYPISHSLLLNPMIAAAAMSFSSVSVIANALRLRTVGLTGL